MNQRVLNKQNIQSTVVANGIMLDKENILWGVQKRAVLTSILFIIMIPDTDSEIKESIKYNTRVSKGTGAKDNKEKNEKENLILIHVQIYWIENTENLMELWRKIWTTNSWKDHQHSDYI